MFNLPLCKLYSNSLMSNLNARSGWNSSISSREFCNVHFECTSGVIISVGGLCFQEYLCDVRNLARYIWGRVFSLSRSNHSNYEIRSVVDKQSPLYSQPIDRHESKIKACVILGSHTDIGRHLVYIGLLPLLVSFFFSLITLLPL